MVDISPLWSPGLRCAETLFVLYRNRNENAIFIFSTLPGKNVNRIEVAQICIQVIGIFTFTERITNSCALIFLNQSVEYLKASKYDDIIIMYPINTSCSYDTNWRKYYGFPT